MGVCGGCGWFNRSLFEQRSEKIPVLQNLSARVSWADLPAIGLRDRADLVWENVGGQMRLGLYGLDPGSRETVDLPSCPMMSPALESWFKEFRERAPSIRKGSVRLRVSPSGERGVWLDFGNEDVRDLFAEKEYLRWLSSKAFVEIGQRRKHLYWKDDLPKLGDPDARPWFETYAADGSAIPLYGPVGGFSQAGFAANRALIAEVARYSELSGVRSWVELFCGNGNFTLALASRGHQIEAIEMDELAVEGLKRSAGNLMARIDVRRADVYLKSKTLPSFSGRGLLVDPPRAGLREVLAILEALPKDERPRAILYVSCFSDVFASDSQRLLAMGYRAESVTGVDQFPHSAHTEWVSLFT